MIDVIQSFLEIKYPYNQICNSCSTWINHNDLWKFIYPNGSPDEHIIK